VKQAGGSRKRQKTKTDYSAFFPFLPSSLATAYCLLPSQRGSAVGGQAYFALDGEDFRSNFNISPELRVEFQELVAELVEWRLASYLRREGHDEEVPSERGDQGATRWGHYPREDIPPLYNLTFSEAVWNSGFVKQPGHLFLLVTLEKGDLAETFQYQDRFLSLDLLQWQSQNRTKQDSPVGRALSRHKEEGYQVHLFVRRTKKIKGSAAPFVCCGDVEFLSWQGDAPITVRWGCPSLSRLPCARLCVSPWNPRVDRIYRW
jgi:hypothetical protein